MNTPAIQITGLGKRYQLGETMGELPSLAQAVRGAARWLLPWNQRATEKSFWALRNVDLTIAPGEVVGVVGKNGAGKSTLLKILSRITDPTTGQATVHGRVASLLEVGTGFHPELTGKENVYLNGSLLGLSQPEIHERYDDIVNFAEMHRFMDTPVKRYSSGMYVRLAFAVAAHLDPEILIVDEVLAVGDAAFQAKCLGKLGQVAESGRTVLFVSHNMPAVRQFCQRAVWLKNGTIVEDGPAVDVVSHYEQDAPRAHTLEELREQVKQLGHDDVVQLTDVRVMQDGHESLTLENGSDSQLHIRFEVFKPAPNLRILVDLLDARNQWVFRTFHDSDASTGSQFMPGQYEAALTLPADLLCPTEYTLRIGAAIYGDRRCTPEYLHVPIHVTHTGRVDRAYPAHHAYGSLLPRLPWTLTEHRQTRSLAA